VVVPADGESWRRRFDVRVEDHQDPLAELRRLVGLARAYELASEGDDLVGQGRHAEAGERYQRALELAPENDELLFFAGLAAAQAGDLDTGVERVRRAMASNAGWKQLLPRLSLDIAPGAAAVRQALDLPDGS
jgi:tetratricopeptide (TPR) repeat protein